MITLQNEKAFPISSSHYEHGMDLRDYFAGQVMSFIFSYTMKLEESNKALHTWGEIKELVAIKSYELADAMMKEREQ
jgi:hypothetical protein